MDPFNQDNLGEDVERSGVPDFSGGPVKPDSENEPPRPAEPTGQQTTPDAASPDIAGLSYISQPEQGPEQGPGGPYSESPADDTGAPQDQTPAGGALPQFSGDEAGYLKPVQPPTYDPYQTYADHSADYAEMQAKKAKEALQNVKPSIGRRILAGLAGGAVTFGGGNGGAVVEKVLNRPAERAQQQWERDEAPIQAKIGADQAQDAATAKANTDIEANNRLKEQNYRTQVVSQYDQGRVANAAAAAAGRKTNPSGLTAAREALFNQAGAEGSKLGYTGAQLSDYIDRAVNPGRRPLVPAGQGAPVAGRPAARPSAPEQPAQKPMTQAQRTTILNQRDQAMKAASQLPDDASKRTALQAAQRGYEAKLGMDPDTDPNSRVIQPDFTWKTRGASAQPAPASTAPQSQGAPAPTPAPTTHTFSLSRWQSANPKGDPNVAMAAAAKQGFKVVP